LEELEHHGFFHNLEFRDLLPKQNDFKRFTWIQFGEHLNQPGYLSLITPELRGINAMCPALQFLSFEVEKDISDPSVSGKAPHPPILYNYAE
jgi:hypothetical protein